MRRWAHQKVGTASHIRSNRIPENSVAQSIPASGSWPRRSLRPNEYPLALKRGNVLVRHQRLLPQAAYCSIATENLPQSGRGGRCIKRCRANGTSGKPQHQFQLPHPTVARNATLGWGTLGLLLLHFLFMPVVTYLEAIRHGIWEEMERDPTVFCLGEDIGIYGGAFKVTDGLIGRFGPERVIDTPIAESAIIGAAFGAALTGLRPVAEFQFMGFIGCAFNQIVNMAARSHYRWGAPAPLVLRGPSGGNVHGG